MWLGQVPAPHHEIQATVYKAVACTSYHSWLNWLVNFGGHLCPCPWWFSLILPGLILFRSGSELMKRNLCTLQSWVRIKPEKAAHTPVMKKATSKVRAGIRKEQLRTSGVREKTMGSWKDNGLTRTKELLALAVVFVTIDLTFKSETTVRLSIGTSERPLRGSTWSGNRSLQPIQNFQCFGLI